jgi:hypothetical protein
MEPTKPREKRSGAETKIGLAINFDDGKWWYAIPKKQNIGDDWVKCNCTWMRPATSVPSNFRHPDFPDTQMHWFHHDTSSPSAVHSYARFGVVTFFGTSDPQNDPMTSRLVWGVTNEEHTEMVQLYSEFLAREAEEKRREDEEARNLEAEAVPAATFAPVPPPPAEERCETVSLLGKCITALRDAHHTHARSMYFIPLEAVIVSDQHGMLSIDRAHPLSELTAGRMIPRGEFFAVGSTAEAIFSPARDVSVTDVDWSTELLCTIETPSR